MGFPPLDEMGQSIQSLLTAKSLLTLLSIIQAVSFVYILNLYNSSA